MKFEIESLKISQVGPIADLTLDFTDGARPLENVLLAGTNGCGKTTILKLICDCFRLFGQCNGMPMKVTTPTITPQSHVECRVLVDNKKTTLTLAPKTTKKQPTDFPPGAIWYRNAALLTSNEVKLAHSGFHRQTGTDVRCGVELGSSQINVPSVIYFPHARYINQQTGTQIQKEDTTWSLVNSLESREGFRRSLKSYLIWLEYSDPTAYEELIQFLDRIDLDGKKFTIKRKELDVVIATRDGNEHPMHLLSSGEQHLVILLAELKRRLVPGSIVLIDEIENSLHEEFQAKLMDLIRLLRTDASFQLIATTHARASKELFESEEIRVLGEY